MILKFRQTLLQTKPGSSDYVDERMCCEYPRLSHTQTKRGSVTVTTFNVEGLSGDYLTLGAALEALRLNQRPNEIAAVPPINTQESAC